MNAFSAGLTRFIPLLLGALLLAAYTLLPVVIQPERGATTPYVLLENRANNELELPTAGLQLVAMAALGALCLGVWNVLAPQFGRAIAVLTALCGGLALTYFIIFARDYAAEEATYLASLGPGFWLMLATAGLLLAQVLLPRPRPPARYAIMRVLGNQEGVLLLTVLAMTIAVGIANPRFVAERNLSDIIMTTSYIAIAAIGMSMVIITGNIDISVGSLMGLLALISGRVSLLTDWASATFGLATPEARGLVIAVSWVAPVLCGALVGALIGFAVTYLKIPSIVVTLGMRSIIFGGMVVWTNGERVVDMPPEYFLAQMRPLNIPMPIYFMVVLVIVAALWMRYSAAARALYAVGGNAEAARLSGLNERRVIMQAFILNGVFAGVASLLYATQFQTIQPTPQPNVELAIISAAVVGGVSILGGTGTVIGAMLAALLLNAIRSALVFINVSPFWVQAVQGVLILLTVLADIFRRRRQST
ncbi:MAG: ABC transporter permease [Anaerolineae bacterium]|jgi:ribose/xylose/arabinose/galactoside ABC-type transport system permease subunit|nr:ABC transporter permease [Anaerolineae bacterium]